MVTHTHSLASEPFEVSWPHTILPPCGPAFTTCEDVRFALDELDHVVGGLNVPL